MSEDQETQKRGAQTVASVKKVLGMDQKMSQNITPNSTPEK